jgi:hypothetical protein
LSDQDTAKQKRGQGIVWLRDFRSAPTLAFVGRLLAGEG